MKSVSLEDDYDSEKLETREKFLFQDLFLNFTFGFQYLFTWYVGKYSGTKTLELTGLNVTNGHGENTGMSSQFLGDFFLSFLSSS